MEKKITVHTVTHGNEKTVYLSKGEAEKAIAVLNAFKLEATYASEKRTATIS